MLSRYGDQVAGVIIGPNDMGVSMGTGLDMAAPDLVANWKKVTEISIKHGKSIGMFMCDEIEAEMWHKEGMNIYWVGTELTMLSAEINRIGNKIKEF